MVFRPQRVRPALVLGLVALLAVACSTAQAGSAQVVGGWASARVTSVREALPSPDGEKALRMADNRVCLARLDAAAEPVCGELAAGDRPRLVKFSPDGSHLLLVAGADERHRAVYVMDTATGAVGAIGPGGPTDQASTGRWGLAGAAWTSDGASVLLLPLATGDDGPLLAVDITTGAVTEVARLPADLVNGQPTIHATRSGIALGSSLSDRQTVWWVDPGAGTVRAVGRVDQAGGAVLITAVDPLGHGVLACPWKADGTFDASIRFAIDGGARTPILTDSPSCAGTVYSADGQFLAMAAELDGGYSLTIVDPTDRRVLTTPLPVAAPTMPPHLTWLGDTVVVTDVSAHWTTPTLVVRLQR